MTYALSGWRAYSHVVRVSSAASRNATSVCSHCHVRLHHIGRDYNTCSLLFRDSLTQPTPAPPNCMEDDWSPTPASC